MLFQDRDRDDRPRQFVDSSGYCPNRPGARRPVNDVERMTRDAVSEDVYEQYRRALSDAWRTGKMSFVDTHTSRS